jgi:transposase-like protein
MRERGGRTRAIVVPEIDKRTLYLAILRNVERNSILHTDEHRGYEGVDRLSYTHQAINHGSGEYVRNGVTTNSIESVFAVMQRGLHGVYHHASRKHLARYVNEFTWRLNDGNVKRHSLERLDSFVDAVTGKRITYSRLTA